jgi:hypothetical protein
LWAVLWASAETFWLWQKSSTSWPMRERVKAVIFSEAVAGHITDKSHAWKNAKHRQQWTNTLKTYAEPTLGTLPVPAIDTVLVKKRFLTRFGR